VRRHYTTRVATKLKPDVEFATERIPEEIHQGAFFKMGDTEADLLANKKPNEAQVRALFAHPQYRYEKAKLKALHNDMVASAFAPEHKMSHDKREGLVLGLRLAWNLANVIYNQACGRDRDESIGQAEKALEEAFRKDHDDFGQGVDTNPSDIED
jgi:hypothetical protein